MGKLMNSYVRSQCDKKIAEKEKIEPQVKFTRHVFNDIVATPNDTTIVCSFSEFGCEIVTALYCINYIRETQRPRKLVVIGWYGRAYLYKHLVDEFWEISEEFQYLRNYAGAFHHKSKNLSQVEDLCSKYGKVVRSKDLGNIALTALCKKCRNRWFADKSYASCPYCYAADVQQSIFGAVQKWKANVCRLPFPSNEKLQQAKEMLGERPVGVFARGRKTYGRNLPSEFYVDLIGVLKDKGYSPIWLGEKESTLPCPVEDVVDFSRSELSRDLEWTLAIVRQCQFTIQFWTASTRLAGLMGIPYILFESPVQIWKAHEGFRRNLCDFGPSKLVCAEYKDVMENLDAGLDVAKRAIEEVESGDFTILSDSRISDIIVSEKLCSNNYFRVGGDLGFRSVDHG